MMIKPKTLNWRLRLCCLFEKKASLHLSQSGSVYLTVETPASAENQHAEMATHGNKFVSEATWLLGMAIRDLKTTNPVSQQQPKGFPLLVFLQSWLRQNLEE